LRTFQREILGVGPQSLDHVEQFRGQFVAGIVFNAVPAEHLMFDGAMPGDDVDAPAALGDVIERRAVLGQMQGMDRAIEDMDGRDQQDMAGDCGHGAEGDESVKRRFSVIAAFRQPLRPAKGKLEAQIVGLAHHLGVVVERPRGCAGQRGTSDVLQIEKDAEHQRLLESFG
jgi:hypothetical protein